MAAREEARQLGLRRGAITRHVAERFSLPPFEYSAESRTADTMIRRAKRRAPGALRRYVGFFAATPQGLFVAFDISFPGLINPFALSK